MTGGGDSDMRDDANAGSIDEGAREDDCLACSARDGDPRALAMLYHRHSGPLLGYLTRVLGSRDEAEDVLHDAYLRIFQGRGRYTGRGRFRAWLFTVATRIARDRQKQARRRGELLADARDDLAPRAAENPLERLAHDELLRRIDSALSDLPSTYAMAFHLRVREGFSYREMAEICDEPEGTLRSRVHHTLKRLRVALAPRMRPPAGPAGESRRSDDVDRAHEFPPDPDDNEARR